MYTLRGESLQLKYNRLTSVYSQGRKSPTKVQQVNVDENMDADLDSDSSPCTIRITIGTIYNGIIDQDRFIAIHVFYISFILFRTRD